MILLIVLAVVVVAAGIATGGLLFVVAGIHREEKAGSLTVSSPSAVASGARAINGVYVRRPGIRYQDTGRPRELSAPGSQETRRRAALPVPCCPPGSAVPRPQPAPQPAVLPDGSRGCSAAGTDYGAAMPASGRGRSLCERLPMRKITATATPSWAAARPTNQGTRFAGACSAAR
jgi:hypothetical protein